MCADENRSRSLRTGARLIRQRFGERSEIEGREECKDLGCSPCRRPRAIDSRASRSLRGRGTRERNTGGGFPREGESDGRRGRAKRTRKREREKEAHAGAGGRREEREAA